MAKTKKKNPNFKVIASRYNRLGAQLFGILGNNDKILEKTSNSIAALSDLMYDPHLSSCIQSRKSGVLSLEWDINRGGNDSKETKAVREFLEKDLDIKQLIVDILEAPLFGYQPIEILWRTAKKNGLLTCSAIAKPPEWFEFDTTNQLRFISSDSSFEGVLCSPPKWLLPRHNATYDNPYGESLLSKCYWPVKIKRIVQENWSIFTEKFGIPYLYAKLPLNTDQNIVDEVVDMLDDIVADGVGAVKGDNETDIKLLDGSTANGNNIFLQYIQFLNAEISKVILSQTLTTEQGETGSLAMSRTHLMVRQDIIDSDKRMVENEVNRLIRLYCDYNFGELKEYPVFELYEEEDVDKTTAERDAILSQQLGVKFKPEYISDTYGIDAKYFELPEPVEPEPLPSEEPEPDTEKDKPVKKDEKELEKEALDKEKTNAKGEKKEFCDCDIQNYTDTDKNLNMAAYGEILGSAQDVLKPLLEKLFSPDIESYNEMEKIVTEYLPNINSDTMQETIEKLILINEAEEW